MVNRTPDSAGSAGGAAADHSYAFPVDLWGVVDAVTAALDTVCASEEPTSAPVRAAPAPLDCDVILGALPLDPGARSVSGRSRCP
ncbi:hypothetical protein [Nocardia sp. NPDC051463]|uniref:hypothetical protein n=1 Tax=Nocardia sp. NPDC051463 TaxID=3154845 RepID=UPI00344CE068